jgi:hypothetical protein
MKINEIKQQVYKLTYTQNTPELKITRPALVKGKDLRQKSSWLSIYNALKLVNDFQQEQTEKFIHQKYKFNQLTPKSPFEQLIDNLKVIRELNNDIEENIDRIESKLKGLKQAK